jgi:enoyl-CoA hydratase/carnithine racemase
MLLPQYQDGIAILTLNRLERMNVFVKPLHEALRVELTRIEDDSSAKVLLLMGAQRGRPAA